MTAPRAREQHHPASPPDRLPPCRGGRPSSKTESAAGQPADLARPRVARRSRPALAAAALLALSGALALPATAQAQTCTLNTGDLWCGVVTVGTVMTHGVDPSVLSHGYNFAPEAGMLSDQTFESYTIKGLLVGAASGNAGVLYLGLTSALNAADRATLVVYVGGDSFALSAAEEDPVHYNYSWRDAGLDWSSDTAVTVRLRRVPAAPTGFQAGVGNAQVGLSWDAPASGADITRHEFRQKTGGGSYPTTWTAIATSAPGGTNQASFTVTGLTNEIAHTFELRAVNDSGGGAAEEDGPVTPTPGICGRTAKIQEVILAELTGVTDCAAVTVADLASITTFGGDLGFATFNQGITSLEAGDFAGLTALTKLNLSQNQLTTLPAGIFSGLTAVEEILLSGNQLTALPEGTFAGLTTLVEIDLGGNSLTAIPAQAFSGLTALQRLNLGANDLSSLPDGVFSGLTALSTLYLGANDLISLDAGVFNGLTALDALDLFENDLSSLPDGVFSGLTALTNLELYDNDLTALPNGLFSGLTALTDLELHENDLTALPAGVFSDLTALTDLELYDNDLTALPDGLFSGLTGLTRLTLGDNPNTGDVLALTVTVEKFGTDQARAKVLAGAPFAVDFAATVVNGSLPTGVTKLAVAAGEVNGTAVTVTRTSGTMAAVTVDIDLTTQPTLPINLVHSGYEFAKATSGLPATILPAVGNNAPVFDPATAEREVAENSAADTEVGAGHSRGQGRGHRRHAGVQPGGDGRGFVHLRRLDPADHDEGRT